MNIQDITGILLLIVLIITVVLLFLFRKEAYKNGITVKYKKLYKYAIISLITLIVLYLIRAVIIIVCIF